MTSLAIDVHGLTKRYGNRTVVDHVDLQVRPGRICGFLGPNGSGKTTTIRMLCGLLTPDEGAGTCLGLDLIRKATDIRRQVGYMTQKFGLYEDLSIRENLDFVGRLFELPRRRQAVDEVFLFDALYGRLNTFTRWAEDGSHHFVHWFTNTGYGPDKMSDTMMLRLRQDKIAYGLSEESSVDGRVIKNNRILFIHSPREHNVIINDPDDFALLLRNSFWLGAK